MSFQGSAEDISVDDNGVLHAKLFNASGDAVDAEFDLNTVLGNNDGNFQWGGESKTALYTACIFSVANRLTLFQDFAGSASDISFSLEGDDNVPVLRANLGNMEGESVHRDVNLGEYIGNNDGSFFYSKSLLS